MWTQACLEAQKCLCFSGVWFIWVFGKCCPFNHQFPEDRRTKEAVFCYGFQNSSEKVFVDLYTCECKCTVNICECEYVYIM